MLLAVGMLLLQFQDEMLLLELLSPVYQTEIHNLAGVVDYWASVATCSHDRMSHQGAHLTAQVQWSSSSRDQT